MSRSTTTGAKPSQLRASQISELTDWRATLYGRLFKLIHKAVPGITQELRWRTAVWTSSGMVCSLGVFKDHGKLNFLKGGAGRPNAVIQWRARCQGNSRN